MNYTEVKIYISEDNAELLTALLDNYGITGTVIENADILRDLLDKKHEYEWDYVDDSVMSMSEMPSSVTFYVDDTPEGIEIMDEILQKASIFNIDQALVRTVSDEEWKDEWKKYFKPSRITEKIIIKPTWEKYEKENENEIVIELDPGMAFGTGTHETTGMCIRLLEKYIASDKSCTKVLDIGCGSGILSIAAALLGAVEVLGIDIDPVAIQVSRENIALNQLESAVSIIEGDLTKGLNYKADIITANLTADLVISLAKDIKKHLDKDGIFISSGILTDKNESVISALEEGGFRIIEILEQGEWCAMAAVMH